MEIQFYKYHGTGNDFILIEDKTGSIHLSQAAIAGICHRRFGIGADGLIILRPHETLDFDMVYYNSDGRTSSMCGNGGRCITRFAFDKGWIGEKCRFHAIDGEHHARVTGEDIDLGMNDVKMVESFDNDLVMDTGSPHYIRFVDQLDDIDLISIARGIRYNDHFKDEGINVNLVVAGKGELEMRTYERGVEDETWSCGTGMVAAAIALSEKHSSESPVVVKTRGGVTRIEFQKAEGGYTDIHLIGPAEFLFSGVINTDQFE